MRTERSMHLGARRGPRARALGSLGLALSAALASCIPYGSTCIRNSDCTEGLICDLSGDCVLPPSDSEGGTTDGAASSILDVASSTEIEATTSEEASGADVVTVDAWTTNADASGADAKVGDAASNDAKTTDGAADARATDASSDAKNADAKTTDAKAGDSGAEASRASDASLSD